MIKTPSLRWLALIAFAAFACAAKPQVPAPPKRVLTAEEAKLLRVEVGDLISTGQVVRIRGHIQNLGTEAIEGVTYRVRFFHERNTSSRVLQTETIPRHALKIAPGERRIVSFEVESIYVNLRAGTNFAIDAWPMELGGREVAPSPDW